MASYVLQEKEEEKEEMHVGKMIRKSPYVKGVYLLWTSSDFDLKWKDTFYR